MKVNETVHKYYLKMKEIGNNGNIDAEALM